MKPHPVYSTEKVLQFTYDCTKRILDENVQGCLIECGVAAGSQIAAMQECLQDHNQNRTIYGLDSFCGIPYAGENDTRQPGIGKINESKTGILETTGIASHSKQSVIENFKKWGLKTDNLKLIEGWFEITVPQFKPEKIALLRLDGDLYSSTKVCLKYLLPMLSENGILIVDDYKLTGCRRAVNEFIPNEQFYFYDGIAYWINK